jgi:hypothetical protein
MKDPKVYTIAKYNLKENLFKQYFFGIKMQQSTLFIIQCIAFAILVFAVFYYFNKKTQYLMLAIESLQSQILSQQSVLEGHDKLFRHLLGPSLYSSIPEVPSIPVQPVIAPRMISRPVSMPTMSNTVLQQQQPQSVEYTQPESELSNPIMDMAPMMSNILGVISSMTSGASNNTVSDSPAPIPPFDENEINEELSKELAELEDKPIPNIKEGRIDSQEESVVSETAVQE